jgi:hypothetical protein
MTAGGVPGTPQGFSLMASSSFPARARRRRKLSSFSAGEKKLNETITSSEDINGNQMALYYLFIYIRDHESSEWFYPSASS